MTITTSIIFFVIFLIIELLYFKVADQFNIIDKPNFRSSHHTITIRGGGIIFTLAILLYALFYGFSYPYFLTGLLIISSISFADDVQPVSNKLRIICHFLAVACLFYQVGLFQMSIYIVALSFVVAIGIINAINFMDGINGLTGVYALISLISFYYLNEYVEIGFVDSKLIIVAMLAVIVFLIFNFRIKAKSFAGDVGSVGIAFIIIFLLASIIITSNNFVYLLLLLVYGLDSVTTIGFRLIRKENIFDAHRSHFYQFLANEKKISHPLVAIGYAFVQLIANLIIISVKPSPLYAIIAVIGIGGAFIIMRFLFEGKERLLTKRID